MDGAGADWRPGATSDLVGLGALAGVDHGLHSVALHGSPSPASRAGRRIEVTTARGVVEVTEDTRGGTPVRTGRFTANRLIALVEHPAQERDEARVEVTTRRRIGGAEQRR